MSLTRGRLRGAGVNDLVFLLVLVIVHAGVDMVQSVRPGRCSNEVSSGVNEYNCRHEVVTLLVVVPV